jgi:hypothetical protein
MAWTVFGCRDVRAWFAEALGCGERVFQIVLFKIFVDEMFEAEGVVVTAKSMNIYGPSLSLAIAFKSLYPKRPAKDHATADCSAVGASDTALRLINPVQIVLRHRTFCDPSLHEPVQQFTIAVGVVRRQALRQPPISFSIIFDHVTSGGALLTQSCGGRLHAHHYTAGVIDEIVVVIAQPRHRLTFARIRRIPVGGGNLVLLVHWFTIFLAGLLLAAPSSILWRCSGWLLRRRTALRRLAVLTRNDGHSERIGVYQSGAEFHG